MVNKLLDLMLDGETDITILQDAWNKMQEQKRLALEEIGKSLAAGAPDTEDFNLD